MTLLDNLKHREIVPTRKNEKWRYSDPELLTIPPNLGIKEDSSNCVNIQEFIENDDYYIIVLSGMTTTKNSILPKIGIELSTSNDYQIFNSDQFEYKHQVVQNLKNSHFAVNIHIKKPLKKPIKLVRYISFSPFFSRVNLIIEKNIKCTLYEEILACNSQKKYCNNLLRVKLDDNSSLNHFISGSFQAKVRGLYTMEVSCSINSIYQSYFIHAFYKSYRFESEVNLNGLNAAAQFYGVCVANKEQLFDCLISVNHHASMTSSIQHYNQVLNDNSIGSFYSNVFIQKSLGAVKAHQLNKNMIIDNKSKAFSRPTLDINSEDIVCSHGAATGNIDVQALDYLYSRGINKEEAKGLIIMGLLKSVFSDTNLKNEEQNYLYIQLENLL